MYVRTYIYVDSAHNTCTYMCSSNLKVHTHIYCITYVCYITLRKNPFPKYVYLFPGGYMQ